MIISASRRTDIPTWYSEWFCRRIKEGFLYVRNPMNYHQISRIDLSPDIVDCIVFWTKNPIPMLGRLDELKDYMYYFQFTLTGYGKDIEKNLPDKKLELIPAFQTLSGKIGPERVIWRYDPIIISDKYSEDYHIRAFRTIAEKLEGCTEKCVISFVDVYQKNKKNLQTIDMIHKTDDDLTAFAGKLASIAADHGMVTATCAELIDLSAAGIEHNSCIDRHLIERLTGYPIQVEKDANQRPECGCAASIDVGAYNTCPNSCKYCYANYNEESVKTNVRKYDPASPLLCGEVAPEDKITDRKMKSLKQRQISLFDQE